MAKVIEAELTTTNKHGFFNDTTDDGEEQIKVAVSVSVPENFDEAVEFYQGEEKLMDSIQQDVKRRKLNAARPVLREADVEMDWASVAQETAEGYEPGRRGGFAPVAESEVAGFESAEEILAYLKQRGAIR